MTALPLVSIIIPVYNGANYLQEAIDSALAQTYPRCEVIVVNDGSSDNGATRDIALSYGSRIRYFEKENGGVATALNCGIREMKGEFFSWLSHDDLYFPHKVDRQIEYLRTNSLYDVVLYSNFEFINDVGTWIGASPDMRGITPESFRSHLIKSNPIHGCTALIPAVCFERVGLFQEHLISTQDYDLWFRMAKHIPFIYQDDILVKSRLHEKQCSRSLGAAHISECNALNIRGLNEMIATEEIPGHSSRSLFALSVARGLLRKELYPAALHAYVTSKHYVGEMKFTRRVAYRIASIHFLILSGVHSLRQALKRLKK
jgi:hypothetical protein